MKVTVIKGTELTPELVRIWLYIQEVEQDLSSPFFCPQFTSAVASVREDTYVGVIENENKVVGFFPFQKERGTDVGKPIGAGMSDYQGLLVNKGFDLDVIELLRCCGLRIWKFDHLITTQKHFEPFFILRTESPIISLSNGHDNYKLEKRKSGTKQIVQVERRLRQLKREMSLIRFETHVDDLFALHKLIKWKSEQSSSIFGYDDFGVKWIRELLEHIHSIKDENFSGLLSVLYCGDKPIAAHMGMISKYVWHWWVAGYDRSYSRYSPGLILLLKMIETTEKMAIKIVDLGKGLYHYKKRFMNDTIPLAEGFVSANS
jgi:CelD/BcsL family acetyltransferase involved in cellulose biosynthesis